MKKRTYKVPASQVIGIQTEDIILATSSVNGQLSQWENGHDDWFSNDFDNSSSENNYWNN